MSKRLKDRDYSGHLAATPSVAGEGCDDTVHDAVFGQITEDGPKYRQLAGNICLDDEDTDWPWCLIYTSSLWHVRNDTRAALSCIVAGITTWSDWMVGTFMLRHLEVYGIADAGELMFGPIGREILGIGFHWMFVSGPGMLRISIGLNSGSTHGACTAILDTQRNQF
ncbi:hypothetical protein ACJZ2D_015935 [Fusarium nematophilum]